MFFISLAISGWACFLWCSGKLYKTQKLLDKAYKNTYSTPVKELTASFRDFVQSIDGHVSPEVDAAIKKLEETDVQKPKALPSAQTMEKETWNMFSKDLNAAYYSDEKVSVIKRWGKRVKFSLADQVKLIQTVYFSDDREALRNYFDKFHSKK